MVALLGWIWSHILLATLPRSPRFSWAMAALGAIVLLVATGGCGDRGAGTTAPSLKEPPAKDSAAMSAGLRMTALRSMQQAPGYEFSQRGNMLTARMGGRGNEASVTLTGERVAITVAQRDGSFGLRTTHVGRRGAQQRAPALRTSRAHGQEAILERAGVEERYLAGPLGLEQSYRIEVRPEGEGELAIEVGFEGLTPAKASQDNSVVELRGADGQMRATYRDVAAVDVTGRELAARMEVVGAAVRLVIDDRNAAYPVMVDPLVVTQEAKLTASDGLPRETFGDSVSISSDTAVIWARGRSGHPGAAYVFVRTGAAWSQQARLTADDGPDGDHLVGPVSISGDTAVVGSFSSASDINSAYVFVRSGTTWSKQAKLTAIGGATDDMFGWSISISGDTIVVGAHAAANYAGAAYVFVRSGYTWSQQTKLIASDGSAGAAFGMSVSVSGDTTVVGAPGGASDVGSTYVFVRSGDTWSQQTKLTASDGAAGDYFGGSVSLSGDTAIVGACLKNAPLSHSGAAYVFTRSGTTWSQQARLTAGDSVTGDYFGRTVSVSGGSAVVGAEQKTSITGAAYVFTRSGGIWSQQAKLTASDGTTGDVFGCSVGISGDTTVVGAWGDDDHLVEDIGAAYAYVRTGAAWWQQAKLSANNSADWATFGATVSISGDTAVVGSQRAADGAGAAYVFVRSGSTWSEQAKLTASDAATDDYFGSSVSVAGDTVVVGSPGPPDSIGATYVFVRSGTSWLQQARLAPSDGANGDWFGGSVSVSGDTVIVGAPEKASFAGAGYVFVRDGTTWSQQAKFTAGGSPASSSFGQSVSLSGDTAVVGAYLQGAGGVAYVFIRDGTNWSQQATLAANDGAIGDWFGRSVSMSGDTAVVGAAQKASNTGAAYVFARSGTAWSQQAKLTGGDSVTGDYFGFSVTVSGDMAVVGVPGKTTWLGAAYVFLRSGSTWSEVAVLNSSDGSTWDSFGNSVSISGHTAVVGAFSRASGTGAAYVFAVRKGSLGDACGAGVECDSSFCVDGVCCNNDCGAGSTADCQACSQAVGATASGTCGTVTDGTACSDGTACTQGDSCIAGVCTQGSPVTCSASDPCHEAGICDPMSGCSNPEKTDGTGCDDGTACTLTDTCQAGQCTGDNPVACPAPDPCHEAGICEPSSGACSASVSKADGTPCPLGTCESGSCVAFPDAGSDGEAGAAGTAGSGGQAGSAGAAGSGGQGGNGGVAGSSGHAGAGGSGGSHAGGAAGTGGTSDDAGGAAGTGGTGDDAGAETASQSPHVTGGCGCRAGARNSLSFAWAGVGLALAAAVARQRRSRGACCR